MDLKNIVSSGARSGFTFQKWLLWFCLIFTLTSFLQDTLFILFGLHLTLARTTQYTLAALVALYFAYSSKK
ncbi:MAG: hypothetical protein IT270_19780 [Saprospiraceae bacterium]|nr:hypothetical protein [Saprospiraceae bacterium]